VKIAVLISGSGSNLQALIDSHNIDLVISNKVDSYGLVRAEKAGIKTAVVNHKDYKTREEFDAEVHRILVENGIEIVCLAGFMRLLTPEFVNKWNGKMLNIHPSLLPAFKGGAAIKDAFEYGVKITGATVHFVIPEMDSGKIIVQGAVAIEAGDTIESLAAKIHAVEHQIYPKALSWLINQRKSL
jgi:phosphoribosylglycinamide formyltransferase 1